MVESVAATEIASISSDASNGLGGKLSGAINLKSVNRILLVLAAISAIYFVMVIAGGAVKLMGVSHHIRQLELKGAKDAGTATPSDKPLKLEVRQADPALSNRNIFQPAGAVVSSSDSGASTVRSSPSYKLVGISESSDPADTYVMIENAQTKLTYFLQYSQPVEGLELEKILGDKVIVKIGGDSVELK
jgi:type II secretory pathway component PulC